MKAHCMDAKNPIIAQDVSITLAPQPLTMASQAGLLNSAYISLCGGGFARLGMTIDA